MIDPRNFGSLTCGVVADPEYVGNNNSVIRFRLAADFSGNDRDDPKNKSGYFSAIYFVDEKNPSNSFITSQIANGNISRGSQISILYKLQQNRYTTREGKKASQVELVIESMSFAGSGSNKSSNGGGSTTSETSEQPQAVTSVTEF